MRSRLPNLLSASRVLLALLILAVSRELTAWKYLSIIGMLSLAMMTDSLDGYLARRWKTVSTLGYVLDAMGDRTVHLALVLAIQ